MSARKNLRAGVAATLAAALLLGSAGTATASTTYTGPTHDQQAEGTLKQLILDARKIEGTKAATLTGLQKAVAAYKPKAAWERGVAFAIADYSLTFGQVSVFQAEDGRLGLATRAFRGGCSMAVVSGNMSTTWTTQDLGKNCTGGSAILGKDAGVTFLDPVPPAAPTNTGAVAGDSSVLLSWTAPADTDLASYDIVQNDVVVANVPATSTSHTVTGLTNDQPYTFSVRAVDQAGNVSFESNDVLVTPTDMTPPAQITGLGTVAGDGILTVKWDASPATDLASYKVYQGGVLVATVPAGTTSLNVGGLTNYTSYSFTVTGVDGHGNESVLSAAVTGTPIDLTAPDSVTGVLVTSKDSSLDVTWGASTAVDLGGYQVLVDGVIVGVVPATSTSYTVTGLTNYTSYDVTVKAVDVNGNVSTASQTVAAAPVDLTPAGVPADLRAVGAESSANITWTGVVASDLSHYNVYVDGFKVGTVPAGTTSYTVPGLVNYTAYMVTVSSVDVNGNESARSAPAEVTPIDLTAPDAVTGLVGQAGDGQASLAWDASLAPDLAGYRIYQDGVLVATIPAGSTSATVAGLTNYRAYNFTVTAVDVHDNESLVGAGASVTPVDLTAPAAPAGVTVVSGDGSLDLSWSPVAAADLGGYNVYVNGALASVVPAGTTTLTVGGLTNYTPYVVEVTAFDVNGNESVTSEPGTGTPVDLTAPETVTGFTATAGDSSLNLAWGASTAADLAGYQVLVNGAVVATLDSATTSYTVGNLVNGTSYTVEVVAVDGAGNTSPASDPITIAPVDQTAPAGVSDLQVTEVDGGAVLNWGAVLDADLSHYNVYVNDVKVAEVLAGTTTYTVGGLVAGTSYSFSIGAVDTAGNEARSTTGTTFTSSPEIQMHQISLTGSAGDAQNTLYWTSSAPDGVTYEVHQDGVLVATTTAKTAVITGLTNGKSYYYVVTIASPSHAGQSNGLDLTPQAAVPAVPASLKVDSVTSTSATFSFGSVAGATTYRMTLVSGTTSIVATSTSSPITVTGLSPETTYSATISSSADGSRWSAESAAVSATTAAEAGTSALYGGATLEGYSLGYGSAVELGIRFKPLGDGTVTGVTFYKPAEDTAGGQTGTLWDANGKIVAQGKFVNQTATGWQNLQFDTPVKVTPGAMYTASYHVPSGYYFAKHYGHTTTITAGGLEYPVDSGVYQYGGYDTVAPTSVYLSSDYAVDVLYKAATTSTGTTSSTSTTTVDLTGATWTNVAQLGVARGYHATTEDSSGRIYAIGGELGSTRTQTASVVRYDPATNAWTEVAPLPATRDYLSAATDSSGRVYAIGGRNGSTVTASVLRYDPAANAWTSVAPLPAPLIAASATTGADGKIYVAGGHNGSGGVATFYRYDPASNSWATLAPLSSARFHSTLAVDASGRVYVIGGHNGSGTITTVERYDAASNTWSAVASLQGGGRFNHSTEVDGQGRIYAIGNGVTHSDALHPANSNSVQRYDPATDTWTVLEERLPIGTYAAAVGKDSTGRFYLIGGRGTKSASDGTTYYLSSVLRLG